MKINKFCQSCGMPAKQDPQGGGTERDGSISQKYCSYCYQQGEFIGSEEIDTAKKMQGLCIEKMTEQGMSKPVAWILTRGIPWLERWKKS
jgi:hypothetical protein